MIVMTTKPENFLIFELKTQTTFGSFGLTRQSWSGETHTTYVYSCYFVLLIVNWEIDSSVLKE